MNNQKKPITKNKNLPPADTYELAMFLLRVYQKKKGENLQSNQ